MDADLSAGWTLVIAVTTIVSIVGCAVFLYLQTTRKLAPGEDPGTSGHVWDDDLKEWNNPLPRWWMYLFYITLAFSILYLLLYPGLGGFRGLLGWSQQGQYAREAQRWDARYAGQFEVYLKQDIATVARDPAARDMGERLFLVNCAQCHGSDAGGARGAPSLRDGEWLWGGSPEQIRESIANGRQGMMPPMGEAVGLDNVPAVVQYVIALSGRDHDKTLAARGQPLYVQACAACHGVDGKGNQALGAPNLTGRAWIHGNSAEAIAESIIKGRMGEMPAQAPFLGEARVHLLAAYVYGLAKERR
jgi:cytochrome c oxidase cbb3-type subunit 3